MPIMDTSILFEPFQFGSISLKSRITMAPMTRAQSPSGVPTDDVAAYYKRRVEGGAALIISEGTFINVPEAGGLANVPEFYGNGLQGWERVVKSVHASGGVFFPQLWHTGIERHSLPKDMLATNYSDCISVGPSGLIDTKTRLNDPMSEALIEQTIDAFVQGIVDAKNIGCDGVELHGAHGYLIDEFFWGETNQRTDKWGGDISSRTLFATEIIKRARKVIGDEFPIIIRFSQWKNSNYDAKLAHTPEQLTQFLTPLIDAGVSGFDCSTRRFWLPEFDNSELNLAGWTKKLTGMPTISVGAVGLDKTFSASTLFTTANFNKQTIEKLLVMMERGDFDLIAVGRAFLANPNWPNLLKEHRFNEIKPYSADSVMTLY